MAAFDTPHAKLQTLLTKDASGEISLRYMTSAETSQLVAADLLHMQDKTLEEILSHCIGVDSNGRLALRLSLTS